MSVYLYADNPRSILVGADTIEELVDFAEKLGRMVVVHPSGLRICVGSGDRAVQVGAKPIDAQRFNRIAGRLRYQMRKAGGVRCVQRTISSIPH